MQGSVGIEVMNSTNPEFNWKTVTKGRRSKKSMARSFNGISKAGYSISPKRVGDFSGSDSDKFSEAVCGQSVSGKSENVPIKKRRHLLQTPLCPGEPPSPQKHERFLYPNYSSGQMISNWEARVDSGKVGFGEGFDHILLCERTEREYNDAGDFSGIELLAAAATMDADIDNDKKEDHVTGNDNFVPKDSDASGSAAQSEIGLDCNKLENSSSNVLPNEGGVDCSPVANNSAAVSDSSCRSQVGGAVPKVNRQHWDLNTLMDAWDEPYDDSVAANTSKDVDNGTHMGDEHNVSIDPALPNPVGTGDASDLKMEERNSASVFSDRTCIEPANLVKHFLDPSCVVCSEKDMKISNSSTENEKDADKRSPDLSFSSDAHKENLNVVLKTDANMLSDGITSKEIVSTLLCTAAVMKDEDCSSNLSKTESTVVSESIQTVPQDINVHYMPATKNFETAVDAECKLIKSSKPRELPGILDVQSLIIDSGIENDGNVVPDSANSDCQGLHQDEFIKRDVDSFPNEGSKGITTDDSCKSSSAGPQCDDPSSSVGKIGSTFGNQHESDISQDNRCDVVDGDETRFKEGYDSPYEDGELRASFSCSWEDDELENECVDYESDGRNGDGPNNADYPGSEIVEDGSEGSHGTQRGSSSLKRLPEGSQSKTGPVRHSLRRYFAKDDSDNNERARKGSNAGSGTTVEQSMDMNVDENDDIMKSRQLTGRRETVDAQMDEYASKFPRGKLQSRIEAQTSLGANDGKVVLFAPQCRSRAFGFSYFRPERDTSPDKHFVRYKPAATHGKREGDDHLTSWGSKRRYPYGYQGSEGHIYTRPRSIAGDVDKMGGLGVHDLRQNANYMSKGLHRPLMRSPSERDDYFPVRKRMTISRGAASSYKSRGHYSQRPGRDFREDFESLADETGAPVRFSRSISRRDRSFSPNSGRNAHMPIPRRKSRSRSRTRSPGPWRRDRILTIRRRSRSPDFRPDARIERMRGVPFLKPTFASGYGENYISPPRNRFSPPRNHPRWVEDHPFADNHLRRRRSPLRVFKRTQKFDSVRLKSDNYLRPVIHPTKRFSFKPNNGGHESKFESSYDDRRCGGDNSDTMHHRDDNGPNIGRLRHNAATAPDNFETSKLNNEDDSRATDTHCDREDKRPFKI